MAVAWDCPFCGAKEGHPCISMACRKADKLRQEVETLNVSVDDLLAQIKDWETVLDGIVKCGHEELCNVLGTDTPEAEKQGRCGCPCVRAKEALAKYAK